MVNYCCVQGCGRNSRLNKHLNFYSLPKERNRQVEWLKAAGRDDLLKKDHAKLTVSHRFCSRHFTPSSIKNRHLCPDAVPSLYLPGSWDEGNESDEDPLTHADIVCNSCSDPIVGFRYKCVSCADFDLCQKCEMLEAHPDHFMLRIPKPMKFKFADNLVKNWRKFFKTEHVTPSMLEGGKKDQITLDSESDDDEPITKYARNYDSGIDLSEDVKEKIRKEVNRVIKLKPEEKVKKVNKKKNEKKRQLQTEGDRESKRMKFEEASAQLFTDNNVAEVVFADVNEINDTQIAEMKTEYPVIGVHENSDATLSTEGIPRLPSIPAVHSDVPCEQPVMHVKLSDDLTELMIEVTSNNQKTIYKYSDK